MKAGINPVADAIHFLSSWKSVLLLGAEGEHKIKESYQQKLDITNPKQKLK